MHDDQLDVEDFIDYEATCAAGCVEGGAGELVWFWEPGEPGRADGLLVMAEGEPQLLAGHRSCLDAEYGPGEWEQAPKPTRWWVGPEGVEFGYEDDH